MEALDSKGILVCSNKANIFWFGDRSMCLISYFIGKQTRSFRTGKRCVSVNFFFISVHKTKKVKKSFSLYPFVRRKKEGKKVTVPHQDSNSRPLAYQAIAYSTAPQRLMLLEWWNIFIKFLLTKKRLHWKSSAGRITQLMMFIHQKLLKR